MYRSIVVGTDSSERACQAVEHAARLAESTGAGLHLVCCVRVPAGASQLRQPAGLAASEFSTELLLETRRRQLDSMAGHCRSRGIPTSAHLHCGDPAATLLGVADEVGADLIVVGNKRLNGLRRFFGSVPGHVTRKASLPVLVVHTG